MKSIWRITSTWVISNIWNVPSCTSTYSFFDSLVFPLRMSSWDFSRELLTLPLFLWSQENLRRAQLLHLYWTSPCPMVPSANICLLPSWESITERCYTLNGNGSPRRRKRLSLPELKTNMKESKSCYARISCTRVLRYRLLEQRDL